MAENTKGDKWAVVPGYERSKDKPMGGLGRRVRLNKQEVVRNKGNLGIVVIVAAVVIWLIRVF